MPTKDGISGTGLPSHRMHTRRVWEAPTRRGIPHARESDLTSVLEMLSADHAKVDELFKRIVTLKNRADTARNALVIQACEALSVHLQLEEELFYPAAREDIREVGMIDESEVEHIHIRELANDLKALQVDDPLCDAPLWDAKIKVLMDYVRHHVKEEETRLFPALRKAVSEREAPGFTGLYKKMVKRREELEQHGMAAAELAAALTKENLYAPH